MTVRTLTTLGLPIRTELRLKSLLAVMDAKTADHWTYVDGTNADVLICEPTSALSTITLKRLNVTPLRCVSLIKDAQTQPLPGTLTLRDPVRAGDLLDLLNSLSATLAAPAHSEVRVPIVDASDDAFRFGTTLRDLLRSSSSDVFMLETGDLTVHVVPATRTVLLQQPLEPEMLRQIAQPHVAVGVMQYPASHAEHLLSKGAHKMPADGMLWRVGLHGPVDRLLGHLSPDARFKLRRWPDFGRLEHSAEHLRIAARMSRKETSLAELASALGESTDAVTPFINACGLCELLQIVPATVRYETRAISAPTRTRQVGIFQSIRSALGFGVSST